jgi:hypothetical protein
MVRVRVLLFLFAILAAAAIVILSINVIENPKANNTEDGSDPGVNTSSICSNDTTVGNPSEMSGGSFEESLILPPQEGFLNNINWSNYSLLRNPYINTYKVSDPTYVNNHKFLYVVLVAEISGSRNQTEIFSQLSGIVLEERKLLGPNSGPTIWGAVDGILVYYATMLPYNDEVIVRYLR